MPQTDSEFDRFRWQLASGSQDSPAPGFALVSATASSAATSGDIQWTVSQPSGANGIFAINSPFKLGSVGRITFDDGAAALYDTGTPAPKNIWIPKSGQWTLTKLNDATARTQEFEVVGSPLSSPNRVPVRWRPAIARIIYGTLGGTLTAGGSVSSCPVSGCINGQSPSVSTVTVNDGLYGSLTGSSGNAYVAIENLANGTWQLLGVVCSS